MGYSRFGAALAVALVFALVLAAQPACATVDYEGLSRTTEKIVRATVPLSDEPCTAPEARVRRLYRRADKEIRKALEVYGYYAPTIDKVLDSKEGCWHARFQIDRGPRVRLRKVSVGVSGRRASPMGA